MITGLLNGQKIDCFSGKHDRDTLKKWAAKGIILCPVCGKPYEYCHGKINSPYFRHKDKAECFDLYSEPETEEHIAGKVALYEWVRKIDGVTDAVLEGWLPETKQRPDIMFKMDGNQYVLEYQCSPIASEYLERHELYKAAGIVDIWVCGTEKYKSNRRRTITANATGKYNSIAGKFCPNYDKIRIRVSSHNLRKREASFNSFELSDCAVYDNEIYSIAEHLYYIKAPERIRLNKLKREQRAKVIDEICLSTVTDLQKEYGRNEVFFDDPPDYNSKFKVRLGWSVAFIYSNRIEFFEANNWPMRYLLVESCVYYNNPQRIKTILTDYMHGNYNPGVKVAN